MGIMIMLNIPVSAAERFPDLTSSLDQARATLAEAETHYAYMRTMRAEDEYIARSREDGGYALDLATRISEAREQYRIDVAEARREYRAALQIKTDAHIALLNAAAPAAAA